MARKSALRDRVTEVVNSGAIATVKTKPVEHDKIYCFQQIAWTISKATSSGNTRCRLYIAGHGYKHLLAEQDAPVATVVYTYTKQVWLTPGEQLALDIDQPQDSTTVEMDITGYWVNQSEGMV